MDTSHTSCHPAVCSPPSSRRPATEHPAERANHAERIAQDEAAQRREADLQQRLQTLSRQLIEAQERERCHLARELHDEIGQVLTGLKFLLEMAQRCPDAERRDFLGEAREVVDTLMQRVRGLSCDLRPALLDDLGLLPALLAHVERYTAQTGIRVTFSHADLERRFGPEVETAAFRVVQEALTNVARHAGAEEVAVTVCAHEQVLRARIEDHGAGFDLQAALAGHTSRGVTGMRERAVLLGGRITITTAPGHGTQVQVEFPLGGSGEDGPRRDCHDHHRTGR